jgi:hypothetical protein
MEISGQLHSLPLYPRVKSPRCPLYRKFGRSLSLSGSSGEDKKLAEMGIEFELHIP